MYNMQLYAVTDIRDWTLGLVFFLLSIVLIQLLAAKPNKPIIIIIYCKGGYINKRGSP